MSQTNHDDRHTPEPPPAQGTSALLEYFWSGSCDLRLFNFVINTVLAGDYVSYIAKRPLAGDRTPGHEKPVDLAASDNPGMGIIALRQSRQDLLEMFLTRIVDNFQMYLTEIIRMVLHKRPEILSGRKQEISLGYILGFDSIESLTQDIIEAKVNSLSYDGFGDIEEWCNGRGIPLLVPNGERDKVVELIATRNLIVHNRAIVDDRFRKAIPQSAFVVGQERALEIDAFFDALSLLNRIVTVSDGAIASKFDLLRTEIPKELKKRSETRWPRSTDQPDPNEDDSTQGNIGVAESQAGAAG